MNVAYKRFNAVDIVMEKKSRQSQKYGRKVAFSTKDGQVASSYDSRHTDPTTWPVHGTWGRFPTYVVDEERHRHRRGAHTIGACVGRNRIQVEVHLCTCVKR